MKESLPVPYIHHHIYSYVYCLRVAKNMTHAFGPAGVTSKFGILKTCSHRAQHIVLLEVDAAPSSNSSFCQPLEPSRSRRSPRSHTLARLSFGTTLGALLECIRINQEWPILFRARRSRTGSTSCTGTTSSRGPPSFLPRASTHG